MPFSSHHLNNKSSDQLLPDDIWFEINLYLNASDTFNLIRADKNLYEKFLLELYRKVLKQIRQSTKIIKGEKSNFHITPDGRVLAWGDNSEGELGMGDTKPRATPTVIPSLKDIQAITAQTNYTLFLNNAGHVFVCGGSNKAISAIVDFEYPSHPTLIPSLINIKTMVASRSHILFLNTTGQVFAMGANYAGQLGIGHTEDQLTPILIPNIQDITAVSVGDSHSLFMDISGRVLVCGANSHGQLGLGDTNNRVKPTLIHTLNNIQAIAGGFFHSLFLNKDGNVFSCGWNKYGQLGHSNRGDHLTPTQISNLMNIRAVAGGNHHSLFLTRTDQTLGCGGNYYGQLGLGENNKGQETPCLIPNLQYIQTIEAANGQSYFRNNLGQTFACGYNQKGALGCDKVGHVFQATLLSLRLYQSIMIAYLPLSFAMKLAHDNTPYGKLCYEACNNYLSTLSNSLQQQEYAFQLRAAPWAEDSLLQSFTVKILNDNVYKENSSSLAFFSMLTSFIAIYHHLKKTQSDDPTKLSADQKHCLVDFVDLLMKISHEKITGFTDLKTQCRETDKRFIQSKPTFFLETTPYCDLREAWVKSMENDPAIFLAMQQLTNLFIDSVKDQKTSTGMGAMLKQYLIQSQPQQLRKLN